MSTAHKQGRLSTEELHEVKQLMGALLALLSFWSLGSLDFGNSGLLVLGSLVALVAFIRPQWVARIPSGAWRWVGPVLLLLIAVDFWLHLPEFIPPLVRMVVLLIIYRMLAPRNQREDLQVILLCLFCVVISGVLTVSLLFAFQILLFAPLSMALLFIICLLDRGEEAEVHVISWDRFEWPRMARRVWQVMDFKILVLCSAMFALVVALSSLLFILTPRFDFDQAIPFLEMSTSARSGFSEEVQLGDVTEIQQDDSVALRVDVPSIEAITTSAYWRMLVLDTYADGHFKLSASLKAKPFRQFKEVRELRSDTLPMSERSGALWTIYMEGAISRYLPMPGDYAAVRFQNYQDVEIIPDLHVLGLDTVGQNVFSYQFEDLKFNRRFEASSSEVDMFESLPAAPRGEVPLAYPYTTLELNLSAKSIAVLDRINQGILLEDAMTAAEFSQAATEYLRGRFGYSLSPDGDRSGSVDPIVGWLESGRQGHCELFAGAFVLLAREAGYPARMAIGFYGGSWNSVEDYFVVRNRDAHAWVEIYDAAEGSWLRVDPTPGNGSSDPEISIPSNLVFESGMAAWMDSLRIQWYRRIVNFEQKDQIELALTLKDMVTESYELLNSKLKDFGIRIKSWVTQPLDIGSLRPFALLGGILGVIYFLWRARYALLGLFFKLLRGPKALDPVRRQASRYLKRIQTKGIESDVVADLKALRFGPERTAREAKPVFGRARKVLKEKS